MKYLTKFIKFFTKDEQLKVLGRWNIDYCQKKINRKIDLSNEDNGGQYEQYYKEKLIKQNINKLKIQ